MTKELALTTSIIALLIPLVLAIILKVKTKCKILPFIVGMLCFSLFASTIESLIHLYLLSINETTSAFIYSSVITYALYGGLMAGLFEETGRLFGFKVLLKKYNSKETALAYGIGHGGIECITVLASTYFTYFLALNGYSFGSVEIDQAMLQTINSIDPGIIPIAIAERCIAIALHIGLSVFVFKAVKEKKYKYYLYAILLHALADVPAAMYQFGLITSINLVELLTLALTIVVGCIAIKLYKNMGEKENVGI